MHEPSDIQLLRDYAEAGHEAAFHELVTRHTDLVYSAALRQVNSPDLAGDIAQGVFTDLARKARQVSEQLSGGHSIAGWLLRSTRYAVLNHWRNTRRRLANERQAMEQLLINSESAPNWEHIRPILDEALATLGDEDCEALLLRYFKNQDFRTVGLALGVTDDTAQKRVSRALERLRDFFSKRRVTIGASGLMALLSANAVQSAPVGLAAAIFTSAIVTGTAVSTAIAATKIIAMTTLQKTLITAALAVVAGAGLYQAHQASQLRQQNLALQQQPAPRASQLQQLRLERDDASNRLAGLQAENAQLKANARELLKLRGEVSVLRHGSPQTNDPSLQTAMAWLAKKQKLQKAFADNPDQRIPEMQFLTEDRWLDLAKQFKLDSEDEIRHAMLFTRVSSKMYWAQVIQGALRKFMEYNHDNWPEDVSQLQAFLDQPMDDAILQRYKIMDKEQTKSGWLKGKILIEKVEMDECRIAIGPRDMTDSTRPPSPPPVHLSLPPELIPVVESFQNANKGQSFPDDYTKLAPYANTPAQKTALETMIKTWKDATNHHDSFIEH